MNVVHIKRNPVKLASMFMRFQEFYESPEFRAKIFTRKQFLQWYKENKGSKYSDDWAGFNLPSWVIDVFNHGCFDPLSKNEMELINCCKNINTKYYIIGTQGGTKDIMTMRHEIAHAMYYLESEYRYWVDSIISTHVSDQIYNKMVKYLTKTGYHEKVFQDEVHAYLMCDEPNRLTKKAHKKLNEIYENFVGKVNVIDQ